MTPTWRLISNHIKNIFIFLLTYRNEIIQGENFSICTNNSSLWKNSLCVRLYVKKSVKEEEETIKRHNLRLLNVKDETPSALAQFQKVNILALKLVGITISWIILVNRILMILLVYQCKYDTTYFSKSVYSFYYEI